MISNETSPDDNTHVSGALGWVKDANDVPKKLKKNELERVQKCSEHKDEEYSSRRARDEPDKPGGETTMLGGAHNIREHTRSVINEYIDRMDAPD